MSTTLYQSDFYTWIHQQAKLLEHKQFEHLDLPNLIEELKDLGNRHYDQLESRMVQLIAHLLKWQIEHWYRSNSWRASMKVQRLSINKLLKRHLSLKSCLAEAFAESWLEARCLAVIETNLPEHYFPDNCPYTLEEVMNPDFFPEPNL